jgi:hypothetical protein
VCAGLYDTWRQFAVSNILCTLSNQKHYALW